MTLKELEKKLKKFNNMKIQFVEPAMMHPGGDGVEIAEVALFLEHKYELCSRFIEYIRPQLIKQASRYLLNTTRNDPFFLLENWLKNEWRDYIIDELHGIKTKAAEKESRESFVDTGAYYRSMIILVK